MHGRRRHLSVPQCEHHQRGTLLFTDNKIDFWAESILVENTGSLIAGSTTAPIGTADGLVTIHLYVWTKARRVRPRALLARPRRHLRRSHGALEFQSDEWS